MTDDKDRVFLRIEGQTASGRISTGNSMEWN